MMVKLRLKKADKYQIVLLAEIINFRKNKKPRSQEKKAKKIINCSRRLAYFFEGREKILDAFQSKIFSTKSEVAGILNPDHFKVKILNINKCFKDYQ